MSQITLLIKPEDIIQRTLLDGNIDLDNLNPVIGIAQTTFLKSFLGLALYNKIYADFVADTLAGEYLIIYEDYIKDILSFQAASLYVDFGGYKIGENGIHKITGENMEAIDSSETEKLVLRYNKLIANVESNFKEYICDKNLPELQNKEIRTENDLPWL